MKGVLLPECLKKHQSDLYIQYSKVYCWGSADGGTHGGQGQSNHNLTLSIYDISSDFYGTLVAKYTIVHGSVKGNDFIHQPATELATSAFVHKYLAVCSCVDSA